MEVIGSIRVRKENLERLKKLKCLQYVREDDRGNIECMFKFSATRGKLIAVTDDWLVEFETGEWQRFGTEAYIQLSKISRQTERL